MFGMPFGPPPTEFRGSFRMALFLFVVLFVLFGVGAYHARAHDGYENYRHPRTNMSCCDGTDCFPQTADQVEARIREVPGGIILDGKTFIPDSDMQEGPNGYWSICEGPISKMLYCVLKPRPSF